MPVTYEKTESMFEVKLKEAMKHVTKQLDETSKAIQFVSDKYDEITEMLKSINEERNN